MSPFVLILVFTLGAGSALAIDMPNNATCEGAAQFSKSQESVSRGTASAFVNDAKALAIAQTTIVKGFAGALSSDEQLFVYLPFEHQENVDAQARSVEIISALDDPTLS